VEINKSRRTIEKIKAKMFCFFKDKIDKPLDYGKKDSNKTRNEREDIIMDTTVI